MSEYQEIRDILKRVSLAHEEHAKEMKEFAAGMKELRESQKEFDKGMKELRESQKETARIVEKTSKNFNGFINNSSRETEEFFYQAIQKNKLKIAGYDFDSIDLNVCREAHKRGHRSIEIDILLLNSQVLAVVEVKTTLHQNDVKNFLEKQIPLFRACFPEHRDKKIIGMVAGKVVNADARELAHKAGFTILTLADGNLIIDDSCQRVLD